MKKNYTNDDSVAAADDDEKRNILKKNFILKLNVAYVWYFPFYTI